MAQAHGLHKTAFQTLRLENMTRSFGAFNALRGISLTVQRGEFIALLGPSGCGKTTALNCVAGLLDVSGGQILLDDTRVDTLRPEERGFGMVFQNYALFPHMSVEKNIGFGLMMRDVAREDIKRRVESALATVRLTGQGAKLPGQLSGGQQQRVAIARAIVIEPPLVLMDEPLSNLDAKLRLEMRGEIRRIHQALGSTTLYVTHDQEEALSLADRIVVLRDGAIRQIGTPADLYARPNHRDVADFMGYRNQLAGVVTARTGEDVTIALDDGGVLQGVAASSCTAQSGGRAIAAVRPEDLRPYGAQDGLAVRVILVEYRGHTFHGMAETAKGAAVYFSAPAAVATQASLSLSANPHHVVVFDEADA